MSNIIAVIVLLFALFELACIIYLIIERYKAQENGSYSGYTRRRSKPEIERLRDKVDFWKQEERKDTDEITYLKFKMRMASATLQLNKMLDAMGTKEAFIYKITLVNSLTLNGHTNYSHVDFISTHKPDLNKKMVTVKHIEAGYKLDYYPPPAGYGEYKTFDVTISTDQIASYVKVATIKYNNKLEKILDYED